METWLNVLQLGGPSWDVKLGRRDAKTASFLDANTGNLPSPVTPDRITIILQANQQAF